MANEPVDVLVFAPHPDDEVIGCGGVIQQALAAGRRVRVAFCTDGDGYPRAAAVLLRKLDSAITPRDLAKLGAARRREAVAAAKVLGLKRSAIAFLGHPDGGLGDVEAAALPGFVKVLREAEASEVYVTAGSDEHRDHSATYRLVTAALREIEPRPKLFLFMVHSDGNAWPPPGPRFERGGLDHDLPWPPPIRIRLSRDQAAAKLRALKAHSTQWVIDHEYLGHFAKAEEIFWLG